jgi:radical SAM superfamily enzyme YgiQ (UPF0313 family)
MIFVNPIARSNTDIPNLAVGYAATMLAAERIVDYNTMPEPADRVYEKETDVLGISFQSRSLSHAEEIREKYQAKFPNSRIRSITTALDVQCCYPFLAWPETLIVDTPFSDAYPFPNYELFDSFPVFQKHWSSGEWHYPLMTSMGCPFLCTYCQSRNRKWYPRSPQNCVDEIKQARERWQIRSFTVMDDCFNLKKDRAIEFCRKVKDLGIEWYCTNGLRADRMDEELAREMAASGCTTVGFGIESADPAVLKAITKGETIEQIESAVCMAKKHFASVSGYFIIGLPGSSYEADMRSIKWGLEQGIYMSFSFYVPFKGTTQNDRIFYGDAARPAGNIYPAELQQKVYDFTRGLSWGGVNRSISRVIGNRFAILGKFGLRLCIKYCLLDIRKSANKLRRILS